MSAGDEYLTPSLRTEGMATEVSAAPRSVDPLVSQECPHAPIQEHSASATGTVSEEDPAGPGSHPSSGPVTQGDLKSSLDKQVCFRCFVGALVGALIRSTYCQPHSIICN